MTPGKEYGSLSEDQFRRLIRSLPELRSESSSMQAKLRGASRQRLREVIGDGVWWAGYYEMTFGEALGWFLFVLDKVEWIKRIAALPDPQEAAIAELSDDGPLEWTGGPGGIFSEGDLFGCTMALQRNVLSVMLYRQSLCGLVEDAREGEDDEALFKAIRVDRSVMACPTAAVRISRAEAVGDKAFFLRLKGAVKGPSQRHMMGMDLKYSLFVLREMGFLSLTDAQLERLFVKVLRVYPDHPNARKNLRKQMYESRRLKGL